LRFKRRYSQTVEENSNSVSGQLGTFAYFWATRDYPAPVRRIRICDDAGKYLVVFLTNSFELPAATIAQLYRCRWQIEWFFKWIKKHLRIKVFFGTFENAVNTQIWIAVFSYVLVAILKKRLKLSASLYEILQVQSLTLFERSQINQFLEQTLIPLDQPQDRNQLILFD
jgi:hypothetical protein